MEIIKELNAYKELADKGLQYILDNLKRKFGRNFLALVIRGSYLTKEFKIGSDIDYYTIFRKKPANIDFYLSRLTLSIENFLKEQLEYKISKTVPPFNFRIYSRNNFEDVLKKDSHAIDMLRFGQLYYPKKQNMLSLLKIKTSIIYSRQIAEEDIKRPLIRQAKELIKKCIYLGKQACFMDRKQLIKKQEIINYFDETFKKMPKRISLNSLYKYLNQDMTKMSVQELINLNSRCHQFFLISRNLFPKR